MSFLEARTRVVGGKELRCGVTTGSCATAAAKAAAWMLTNGRAIEKIEIITPSQVRVVLDVIVDHLEADVVKCHVIKDAGDDPDVTHRMAIYAEVSYKEPLLLDGQIAVGSVDPGEHEVVGGIGIGMVTRSGLQVEVGKHAINPVPMAMIRAAVSSVAPCPLKVIISAPEGVEVAKRTFNPKLGIVGGISILGTSGIVEPMSEKAIIDTIQTEIAQRAIEDKSFIILTPGNYGLSFLRKKGLSGGKPVKISNFIGEALDFCSHYGFEQVLLVGHIGKLCKVAGGIFNTHSKVADGRKEIVGAHYFKHMRDESVFDAIMESLTTDTMVEAIESAGHASYFNTLVTSIEERVNERVHEKMPVGVILFTTGDRILAIGPHADRMIESRENRESGEEDN